MGLFSILQARIGELAFVYLTTDEVSIEVFELLDSAEILDGYTSHFSTPVCEDGRCHDVELTLQWDILGAYRKLVPDPDQPLTKKDHQAFNQEDYWRLNTILSTSRPAFIHLRRSELITEPASDATTEIDGVTGATVQAVKKDMVEGAIYTCYTLWHIANGGITFKIQQHTKSVLTNDLIEKYLNQDDASVHFFIAENMTQSAHSHFLKDLMKLSETYDPYFVSKIIERISPMMLRKPQVQVLVMDNFTKLEYLQQSGLINNFISTESATYETLAHLAAHVSNDSDLNEQIITLICQKSAVDRLNIRKQLLDYIYTRGVDLAAQSMHQLESIVLENPSLKSKVERLNNTISR